MTTSEAESTDDRHRAGQPTTRPTKLFYGTVRLLTTAVLIPAVVSIATSFYINTRLLKPRLRGRFSVGDVMVMPVKDHPNDYIVALLDLWLGLGVELPQDGNTDALQKRQTFTRAYIASAKRVSFKTSAEYSLDRSLRGSRVVKVMLSNDGYVTATHIKVGIAFPSDAINWSIVPSPNIKLAQQSIAGSGENPAHIAAEIDRLGANEKALLTVTYDWGSDKSSKGRVRAPYLVTHDQSFYDPVLYITSDEGNGEILPGTSWADGVRWEQANFPYSATGYWASRIRAKPGARPTIEDVKDLNIEIDLELSGKTIPGLPQKIPGVLTSNPP